MNPNNQLGTDRHPGYSIIIFSAKVSNYELQSISFSGWVFLILHQAVFLSVQAIGWGIG